jgi:hypothetical protein
VIEISRSLARNLWAVLRRCIRKPYGSQPPTIEFLADADGLRVRVTHHEVAAEYRQPDPRPADTLRLPMDALSAFAGRGEEIVTLEAAGPDKVLVRWSDGGVPQLVEYEASDAASQPTFPPLPESYFGNPPELIGALDEAVHTVAADATRYAMNRVLLRGGSGDVAATDGQQLLVCSGFQFGWAGDALIPAVPVFGGKELGPDQPVEVGRTDEHVTLRVGAWTFWLRIDADGRFPSLDGVVPKPAEAGSYLRIAPADATFLGTTLPRLPARDDDHQPLTVDLNGRVCVRARAEGQSRTTEVVLARSEYTGEPARLCLNRLHLARALRLGLADAYIVKPTSPVLFRDDRRQYVVMPLSPTCALAPAGDALRIESAADQPPLRTHQPERTAIPMSTPSSNGHETAGTTATPSPRRPTIRRRRTKPAAVSVASSQRHSHCATRRGRSTPGQGGW